MPLTLDFQAGLDVVEVRVLACLRRWVIGDVRICWGYHPVDIWEVLLLSIALPWPQLMLSIRLFFEQRIEADLRAAR